MIDSIQTFLICINHSLCPFFMCVVHFDSIYDFLNRITVESNQNTLIWMLFLFLYKMLDIIIYIYIKLEHFYISKSRMCL